MHISKKAVRLREATLLLHSQVIEDYPWLRKFLKDNPELTDDQIKDLDSDQQNFFENMFPRLVQQAQEEWKGDPNRIPEDRGPDRSAWENCSLCHQPNRLIFYIVNTVNENTLNVGGDCLKAFDIKFGESIYRLAKNARELRRVAELNQSFPGIARLIEDWSHDLDRHPILVSAHLENRYMALGRRLTQLFEDYRGGKKGGSSFDEFAQLLNERKDLIAEIERYVAENKDKRFAPTNQVAAWLRNHPGRDTNPAIQMLKEDGEVTERTLWRIGEPQLVRSLGADFERVLRPAGVSVEKADVSYRGTYGYVLIPSSHRQVRLFCKHKDLAMNYAGPIFGSPLDTPPRLQDVVARCEVYDNSSHAAIVDLLAAKVKRSDVALKGHDLDSNEIDVLEVRSGKYVLAPLCKMVEEFKGLALDLPGKTVEDLVRWVADLPGKRMTREELKQVRKASDAMTSIWDTQAGEK